VTGAGTPPPSQARPGGGFRLLDVPTSLWSYGVVRPLAFLAPTWSGGRIGLGVVVTMVLFVFVLRRSRRAWVALVCLDTLSLSMLILAWSSVGDAPVAAPLLATLGLILLVVPPVRHYVRPAAPSLETSGDRPATVPGSPAPT
jgi:hypothetical protein